MIETVATLPLPGLEARRSSLDSGTVDPENPWPGLDAFREADHLFFFGRERETETLRRAVLRERLTVLFGRSGLGKTSLLQAGLFPRLRQDNFLPVRIRLDFGEGVEAGGPSVLVRQVREAIARAALAAEAETPPLDWEETLWETFHHEGADFWSLDNRLLIPLLVFDQFEEIFTLGKSRAALAEARDRFLIELADLIEGRPPAEVKARLDASPEQTRAYAFQQHNYKVLLSLREDFLADLEGLHDRIPSLGHNRIRLRRMNGEEALRVVTGAGGRLVEEDVARRIVGFVAGEVAATGIPEVPLAELEIEPALLSVVCRELNNMRRQQGEPRITADLLAGHWTEILSDFYERSLADLAPEVRIFIENHLITESGYRDSVALETALREPGITREVIALLIDRRLLRKETRGEQQRIELTHDVLTGVIRDSRDTRRQREAQRTSEAARLAAEERERKARHELRRSRMINFLLGVLSVAAVCLAGFAWYEHAQAKDAESENVVTFSQTMGLYGAMIDELEKSLGDLGLLEEVQTRVLQRVFDSPEEGESIPAARLRRFAHAQMAEIYFTRGETQKALDFGSRGLSIAERLAGEEPQKPYLQDELALSLSQVGNILKVLGRPEQARRHLFHSLKIRQRLVEEEPGDANQKLMLMLVHSSIGDTLQRSGGEEAMASYRKAWAIGEELAEKYAGNVYLESNGCDIYEKILSLKVTYGLSPEEFDGMASEILKVRKEIAEKNPDNEQFQLSLASSYQVLAFIDLIKGRDDRAVENSTKALEIVQAVAGTNPNNMVYQFHLAYAHGRLGEILWGTGQAARTGDHHRAVLRISQQLAERDLGNRTWQSELAGAHSRMATSLLAEGDIEGALEASRAAITRFEPLLHTYPNDPDLLRSLAWAHTLAGRAYEARGEEARARKEWSQAVEIMAPVTRKLPRSQFLDTQVRALLYLGRTEEARPLVDVLVRRGWNYTDFRELLRKKGLL